MPPRFSLLRNSLRPKVVANAAVVLDSDDDDDLSESKHIATTPGSIARTERNKRVLNEVGHVLIIIRGCKMITFINPAITELNFFDQIRDMQRFILIHSIFAMVLEVLNTGLHPG